MKAKILRLSHRVSTKTDIDNLKEQLSYTSYQDTKLLGQLLIENDDNYVINLSQQLYLPSSLNMHNYRIEVQSELPITTSIVDYYKDAAGVEYADKVLEMRTKEFKGSHIAPILFEIDTSNNIKAGKYSINFSIYESTKLEAEKLIWQKNASIDVLNFKRDTNLPFTFKSDIWQQPSNLARQYNVELWSEDHFKLLESLMKKMTKINQQAVSVVVGEVPWCGWGSFLIKDFDANLYEYSIVKIFKENNQLICDFKALDRYIKLAHKYCMDSEIDLFGLLGIWGMPYFSRPKVNDYPENITLRVYDTETNTFQFITEGTEIEWYIKELFAHFKEIGVWDRVRIMSDEPKNNETNISNFKSSIRKLNNIAGEELSFKVAIDKISVLESIKSLINKPVLSYYCATQYRNQLDFSDDDISFYVCNYPSFPNTYLKSELWESRLLGVVAYRLGVNGLTRWAANCWPNNARHDIRFNTDNLPTGDLCLYYPGDNGDILESLRTKKIEEGIEDWNLIKEASQYLPQKVKEIVMQLFNTDDVKDLMLNSHTANLKAYQIDGESLDFMRIKLIEIIKKGKSN